MYVGVGANVGEADILRSDGLQKVVFVVCFPGHSKLEEARKLTSSREILLWMTPSEDPNGVNTSCVESPR